MKTNIAARYNCALATVDIACIDPVGVEGGRILVGRKKGQVKFRLPGGFVDTSKDKSFEDAAKRELGEEVGLIEVGPMFYFGSYQIDDPRYREDKDKIFTTLFICQYIFGAPKAADDLEEVKWLSYEKLKKTELVPEHEQMRAGLLKEVDFINSMMPQV